MAGYANKGLFSISKEPFSGWLDDIQRVVDNADERLNNEIGEVFDKASAALQTEIRRNPQWPSEIADTTTFDKADGQFKVDFDDPRVPFLEYGGKDGEAPAPLLRTFADAHEQEADANLTAAVRRATGL